jgi:hypothetical protein
MGDKNYLTLVNLLFYTGDRKIGLFRGEVTLMVWISKT